MAGWMAVGMCLSPLMVEPSAAVAGWTATQRMLKLSSRKRRVVPIKVPLEPTPTTKWVRRPPVCHQISLAKVW